MREAVLLYKKTVEFEDNVTLAASAGYYYELPGITPDSPTDLLLGHQLIIHPDCDLVGDMPPYTADTRLRGSEQSGEYSDQSVRWSLLSYAGIPGTYFIHATIVAVYAVSE